ncbi:MAG: cytochrome bc complex cytochrome b subunit [Candidatus Bathyarchaeia archaeon]
MKRSEHDNKLARLVKWFDSRLGLSYPLLRAAPAYSINPFYWLGALTVVAFLIQGVTGVIMMLYYVPSPAAAFPSTQYLFQNVYYGRFLQTVHLYTAYAMIVLAFMHMMRGYFVSVYKKPREMMWVVGMVMGFVTLGFGFTGYLLPWTVISKSATDVGIGIIDALPPSLASFVSFLAVGAGGDATELLRFYDLHVVVLPAVLLVLLTAKMYMLETHGISKPATGQPLRGKETKLIPIFPDVLMYLLELAAIFGSMMLLISVIFPLSLPPQYTPELAAQFVPQPDWYFLWIYQILKISIFEGPGLPIALAMVTIVFIVLILLPFIDRGERRMIRERPVQVTLGLIFIGELIVLAYWGLLTPGQIIPSDQAAAVLGGTALIIALVSFLLYRLTQSKRSGQAGVAKPPMGLRRLPVAICFVGVIALGSLGIGRSLNDIVEMALSGFSLAREVSFGFSLSLIGAAVLAAMYLLYWLGFEEGSLKRRIYLFDLGLRANGPK